MASYPNSLQTLISEFKTLRPEITSIIVFKSDGEIIASSEKTKSEEIQALISNLNSITYSEIIGGIESLTIQDSNTHLNVTAVNGVRFAAFFSRTADPKVIKSFTKIVLPTVIRLAWGVESSLLKEPNGVSEAQHTEAQTATLPSKEKKSKAHFNQQNKVCQEPTLPNVPTAQFMVERIGGLLVAVDTVRIDSEVIAKWKDLCSSREFSQVNVETLEGKTVTCKFKAIKDAKPSAKGSIQIPEKLLKALQCSRGNLVIVKPSIE